MFIGHYGPAVWDTQRGHAKPIIKLWEAFLAVQAMDLMAGTLVMFGIEGTRLNAAGDPIFHVPWSHSLLSAVIIALVAGCLYRLLRPASGKREFGIIALLVFSHWILDLVVHRPDLPFYPGGETLLGFALWDFPWLAFALEAGMLGGALLFWQKVTTPKRKTYDYAIWALFLLMVAAHFAFIVHQGLQVQNGTFDITHAPPDLVLGLSFLFVICLFATLIGWIEKGRPSKFA
ncbi:MAG: hypothetical protein HKN36_04905 [Hellea sp.]|nr:hypothetical protein [Hellea sp.]